VTANGRTLPALLHEKSLNVAFDSFLQVPYWEVARPEASNKEDEQNSAPDARSRMRTPVIRVTVSFRQPWCHVWGRLSPAKPFNRRFDARATGVP